VVEAQKDPLEPPRFRLNQKVPPPPPSPPAPVMHSPPRKITAEEHKKWKIPPCVSSWKNPRGYTVPLDKRCAFNGRTGAALEPLNPKFAKLAETLHISTKQHREELEERMKAEKLMAIKEKERNQETLRMLAQQAREARAADQRRLGHGRGESDEEEDEDNINDDDVRERDRIRDERHRDRIRNVNLKASAPDKRTKLDRQRERDISEQIALGMAKPNTLDQDVHDQRLYNQSEGLGSGFGHEDDYTVYDKAWKSKSSFSTNYRPSESVVEETRNYERESNTKTKVKEPLAGANDPLAPIQFEKDDVDNVFDVESFLKKAKYNAGKMREASSSGNPHKRHKD